MIRLAALVGVLAATAAWAECGPSGFIPHGVRGATQRGLSLDINMGNTVLKERGKVVWTRRDHAPRARFTADDGWVAYPPEQRDTTLTFVATRKDGPVVAIDVLGALTKDERARLVETECAPRWLSGWDLAPRGFEVRVLQPRPGNGEPAFPDLVFLAGLDGTVTRLPSRPEVDLAALAARWQGPASDARERTIDAMHSRAATQTGQAEAMVLGPFLKKVFATADAREQELVLAALMIRWVPAAERPSLAEAALARPGAEVMALMSLHDHPAGLPMARKVFDDRTRPADVRFAGLTLLTQHPADAPTLKAALADADPAMRRRVAERITSDDCDAPLAQLLAALRAEDTVDAIGRCLRNAKTPDRHAEAAKVVAGGVRVTSEIYLALAVWAEQASPETAPKLLDLAEQAGRAQKGDGRLVALAHVAQWRVLRALRAKDGKAARAAIAKLDPTLGWALPKLEPGEVGTVWRVGAEQESAADFIARMKPLLK